MKIAIEKNVIKNIDCIEGLHKLPDDCVDCVITSPPYWGLRDYGVPGQLGLEPTLDEYLERLTRVFHEVKRVLKPDGTLWVNMGDAYAAGGKGGGGSFMAERKDGSWQHRSKANGWRPPPKGLKPKDLIGQPWRLAFALQADGWYLRSDIIWSKPNPMPESVTDRPTKAHEYVFLMSKQPRYYYDADAVREGSGIDWESYNKADGRKAPSGDLKSGVNSGFGSKKESFTHPAGRNKRTVWEIATQPLKSAVSYGNYHIPLPSCPNHGCQACRFDVQQCDAQQLVSWFDHNLDKYFHPAPEQADAAASKPEDRREFPFDAIFAKDHSTGNYKTADGLEPHVTFCGKSFSRTEYMKVIHRSCAIYDRIHANNIELDSDADVKDFCLLAQTVFHKTYKYTCCHYTERAEKRQDHYAAFPEKLVEPCVLAGTSEKGYCSECGRPWGRVTDKTRTFESGSGKAGNMPSGKNGPKMQGGGATMDIRRGPVLHSETIGWEAGCNCSADKEGLMKKQKELRGWDAREAAEAEGRVPGLVLDPFMGSGTVALVAHRLDRDFIGFELSKEYCDIANKRIGEEVAQHRLFV